MKKILVLAILAVLFAVMGPMASTVYAGLAAGGSVIPPVTPRGGNVVITVHNVGDAALVVCHWIVTRPAGTRDQITPAGEQVNPGESWSYTYPADFGGSTDQTGTYTVKLGYTDFVGNPCQELQLSFEVISGCFIATAAYGSPMAPQIQVLRDFRDQCLLTNLVGEALVDFYYQISPPIAEFITEHPALKPVVRAGLVPAVAMSTIAVNTTLAEKIAIASSVVLVSTLAVIWFRRRIGKARSAN
jgi:hypothetical protein